MTTIVQKWLLRIKRISPNLRAIHNKHKIINNNLNINELKNPSKVPDKPVTSSLSSASSQGSAPKTISIDIKTVQLLERLSLVRFEDQEILQTLKKSIEFAAPIHRINTENVQPMYTVLEKEDLPLRADTITEGNCRSAILKNASVKEEDYFVSPTGNIPLKQNEDQ